MKRSPSCIIRTIAGETKRSSKKISDLMLWTMQILNNDFSLWKNSSWKPKSADLEWKNRVCFLVEISRYSARVSISAETTEFVENIDERKRLLMRQSIAIGTRFTFHFNCYTSSLLPIVPLLRSGARPTPRLRNPPRARLESNLFEGEKETRREREKYTALER